MLDTYLKHNQFWESGWLPFSKKKSGFCFPSRRNNLYWANNSTEKSHQFLSINWLGCKLCMACKILLGILGFSLASVSTKIFIFFRARFSCEPHKLQGMIGNCCSLAKLLISASWQYTIGRITICFLLSDNNFGGIDLICPA